MGSVGKFVIIFDRSFTIAIPIKTIEFYFLE